MARHPCGICKVNVLDSDEAVQCDGKCSLWHHRECLGMTLDVYLKLSKGHEDWVCRKCIKQEIKDEAYEDRRRQNKKSEMGKTNKVECEKLDVLTGDQKCVFCNTKDIDEMKYGPIYMHKNIITHYYCLLLSSNMEQNGGDSDGILGFLPKDISKEVKRGVRLYCSFCRVGGATLGCAVPRCKVVFHLPCGIKHSTLHQFFGQFKSYCAKHRPVQRISEKILAESSKGAMCGICYEKVVPRPVHETLWAPCCQKSAFFHRDCVQKLATSAGYFFKCPLCNNSNTFQQAMKEFGIYIPEQDASWECVPHAYQDLLVRHDTCDSAKCSCPNGRKTNIPGTRWELILCKYCGSQGIHIGCGRLKWKSPEFECDTCARPASESPLAHSRNQNGNRHRLSGMRRTADIHPSVSADRERGISDSSQDSSDFTISNRSRRVVSPKPEFRVKTPPSSKKASDESAIMRLHEQPDDVKPRSQSIIIDDSSDDDVELVSETKGSGCITTPDGCKIQVVQVKQRSDKKRLRAEGDVKILPKEIVDITKSHDVPKRPRIISPVNITELEFSLDPPKPSTSAAFSVPSTSFAPDPSRFILVDQTNFRPEDLPPGTLLYRSVQPMMNVPQTQPHIPQVQPQLQLHQPQVQPTLQIHQPPVQQQIPTSIPVQQLGPDATSHADAKHSDLSEHWSWRSDHHNTFNFSQYCQKISRSFKCDSSGRRRRRRRRNSGCDNNRLNPRVMLTPLRHRISSDGYLEILVPSWTKIVSTGKKVCPLPSKPARKRKISPTPDTKSTKRRKTSKNDTKKRKKIDTLDSVSPGKILEDLQENKQKKEKTCNKRKTCQENKKQTTHSRTADGNAIITNFFTPTNVTVKKKKKTTRATRNEEISSGEKENEKLKLPRRKHSSNKLSFERSKKKALLLLGEWKCKKIDSYLKLLKDNSKEISVSDSNENNLSSVSTKDDEKIITIKTVVHNLIELVLNQTEDNNHTDFDHNSDVNCKDVPKQGEEFETQEEGNVNDLSDFMESLKPENIRCIQKAVLGALQDPDKQIEDSHNSFIDDVNIALKSTKVQDAVEEIASSDISDNYAESHNPTDDSEVSFEGSTKTLPSLEDFSVICSVEKNTSHDVLYVEILQNETHEDHQKPLEKCVNAVKESLQENSNSYSVPNNLDADLIAQIRDIDDEKDCNPLKEETIPDILTSKHEENSFHDENGCVLDSINTEPLICNSSMFTERTKLRSSSNKSIGVFPKIRFLPQVESKTRSSKDVTQMKKSPIVTKSKEGKCKKVIETPSSTKKVCKKERKSDANKLHCINQYFSQTQKNVFKQSEKHVKYDSIENKETPKSPVKRPLVELQFNIAPLSGF